MFFDLRLTTTVRTPFQLVFCLFLFTLAGNSFSGFCQEKKVEGTKDLEARVLMFNGFASFTVPFGNLSRDYGNYGEIGGGIQYQTKKKWIMGLEGGYFFGNGVKKDPVENLRTADGNIIGSDGSDASFKVFQRGTNLPALRFGKTFNVWNSEKNNSLGGLTALAGVSWFRHWTYIQDISKKTAQFSDEYRKGYQRLSGGPALSAWIGYLYLPESNKLNLHLEAGFTKSFTKSQQYNFVENLPAGAKRNDSFFQIRLRICFIVKSRSEETVYYY